VGWGARRKNKMSLGVLITHSGIRASVLVASLAASILIARTFGPEGLAQYSLVLLIFNFVTISLIGSVGSYVHRIVFESVENKKLLFVLILFLCYLLVVFIVISIFFVFLDLELKDALFYKVRFGILLLFSNIVVAGLLFTLLSALNILGRLSAFSIISLSYAVLSFLVPYLLVSYLHAAWEMWLIGVVISQIFCLFAVFVFLRSVGFIGGFSCTKFQYFITNFEFKSVLNFSLPIAAASALGFFLYNSFRLYLVDDLGLFEYGRFVAAYTIVAGCFGIVEQVTTAVYQPNIYRELSSGSISYAIAPWNKFIETMLVYLVGAMTLLVIIGAEISVVIFGDSMGDLVPYLKLAVLLEFSRVIATSILFYFQISKETNQLYLYYIVAAPVILLCYQFLPWTNLVQSWVVSITLGICASLLVILIKLARKKSFVNFSYGRIFVSAMASILLVYIIAFVTKDILSIENANYFIVISTCLFVSSFLMIDIIFDRHSAIVTSTRK
jgi:O-antigen/teichoic acid export membrane protein